MAKKKSKADDSSADASTKTEKKEIKFDLSDGFDWRDIVGIFLWIFIFIWRVIRLIFSPIFWTINEITRMFKFIRATGKERTMNEDEQLFVESVPFIFMMTGAVGGVIVGIFAALSFSKNLDEFADNIKLDFLGEFFDGLGWLLSGIIAALLWVARGVGSGLGWAFDEIKAAFGANAFAAFMGLATIGIVVILLLVVLVEKGLFEKTFGVAIKFFSWLIGSPERFRFRMDNYYRKFNHKLAKFLVGESALMTRTQTYFKKSVFVTVLASFWSFSVGVYVGVTRGETFDEEWKVVGFAAFVLFVAGILSGTLFFALMARFLDLMNRKKYISPEYIQSSGEIDKEKIDKTVSDAQDKREKANEAYEKKLAKMAEKPWKKRKESGPGTNKDAKPKKAVKAKEEPKEEPKDESSQ